MSTGDVRDALAERFDADLGRRIRELSTGNRQKLGLIQAFMHEPELLILDEPIAGLDPLVQRSFHALLREVAEEGRTVLLSSHTLSEVERVADRVAILRRGRLVVVDSLEGLRAVAIQRLEIEFVGAVPRPEELRAVPGVREVTLEGAHLVVAFEGSADALVKALAAYEVRSIRSRDDDLEEIFLRLLPRSRGTVSLPALRMTLRLRMLTTLLAAFGMVVVILMVGALFPAVGDSIGKLNLPKGITTLLGGADYGTLTGWMRSEIGAVYGPLLVAYIGISVAASSTAGDEEAGILALTLAHPDRAHEPRAGQGGRGRDQRRAGCARHVRRARRGRRRRRWRHRLHESRSAGATPGLLRLGRRRACPRRRRVDRASGARLRSGGRLHRARVPRQRLRAARRRASNG